MAETTGPPRRRRMSRHISLVLLGSLPALAGCGGCGTQEVDEVTEEAPPEGPEHLIGGSFVGWWHATHPPVVVRKRVPRSTAATGGYTRGRSRIVFIPIGGRSSFFSGSSGSNAGRSSSPAVRGGFGSSGRGAVGG